MRKALLLIVFVVATINLFAQDPDGAEKLISQGVALHEKGDYNGAIAKYDKALQLDKNNLMALAEKSYSLMVLGKFEESIACCKTAIAENSEGDALKMIYLNYGTALDNLKKPEEAIEKYDEGLAAFPGYYLIEFNKGITLLGISKTDEAMECFLLAAMHNPNHAGSQNAIARILRFQKNRIASIMAYCRFLVIESDGTRAEENLEAMLELMSYGVDKTGKKKVTINMDFSSMGDTTADGKPTENSFGLIEFMLSLDAALDFDKKYAKMTEVELFIRKFDNLISSLKEGQEDHFGFYWDYYVPYFVEMKEKNMVETFGYIAFSSTGKSDVKKWIDSHSMEILQFYSWSEKFEWFEK